MSGRNLKSEKLKIAMLGHKRIPSREGGVEVVVEALAVRMADMCHAVTCYNRKGEHIAGNEFNSELAGDKYKGVRIKQTFTVNIKGVSAFLASFFSTLSAIRDRNDVIHYHAEGPCGMLWLPHLLGIKTVATIHGLDWKRDKWKGGLGSKYILFGERMAVKYADEIIVLSKNVQQYFLDTYRRETNLIPNGVDKVRKRDGHKIKEKWGLDKDSYILFLGRIVPEKGVHYLIEAYKKLITDKKLVIAGSPSDTAEYFEKVRKMADGYENIIFTGFIQGDIYEELFSNAYIYVLPSNLEGMPLSLLEAMSYGNCCLVSDIPECTEVVEDKAEIFEKNNSEDLNKKLQILCDDVTITNHYKSEAADFIYKKYNWDEIVLKTLDLYYR